MNLIKKEGDEMSLYLTTNEALEIFLGNRKVEEICKEVAFEQLATIIADSECNEHKMTYQEWELIVRNKTAEFRLVYDNNEKYLKSLNRE